MRTVAAPAMTKAHRQLPVEAISPAMMMPPRPAPSGAPASRMVAPRPRSDLCIQMALSLPPAGMTPASVTPMPIRAMNMLRNPPAMPEAAVAAPQPTHDAVMTLRGPNLSISQPTGICMRA